jgi:hypothetical protein
MENIISITHINDRHQFWTSCIGVDLRSHCQTVHYLSAKPISLRYYCSCITTQKVIYDDGCVLESNGQVASRDLDSRLEA